MTTNRCGDHILAQTQGRGLRTEFPQLLNHLIEPFRRIVGFQKRRQRLHLEGVRPERLNFNPQPIKRLDIPPEKIRIAGCRLQRQWNQQPLRRHPLGLHRLPHLFEHHPLMGCVLIHQHEPLVAFHDHIKLMQNPQNPHTGWRVGCRLLLQRRLRGSLVPRLPLDV